MKHPVEKREPLIPGGMNPWLFLFINVALLLIAWWMFTQIMASPVMHSGRALVALMIGGPHV